MSVPTEVAAYEAERLRQLAERPNTTVMTVKHDFIREPWAVERVKAVLDVIVDRARSTPETELDDFRFRKALLDDDEVRAFQRQHPKLYWMVTDRKLMREPRFRATVTNLLNVRQQVQRGRMTDQDADAMATQTVMATLTGGGRS